MYLEKSTKEAFESAHLSEAVIGLAKHIMYPCVDPISGCNIRYVYLKEAHKILTNYDNLNPFMRIFLEYIVEEYKV